MASTAAESKPTTCSATRSLKRAGVAVWSATVRTTRALAAVKIARAFAGKGSAHVASAVDRGSLNLTGRVVARASHHGSVTGGRLDTSRVTPLAIAGHAAQSK